MQLLDIFIFFSSTKPLAFGPMYECIIPFFGPLLHVFGVRIPDSIFQKNCVGQPSSYIPL